MLGRTSDGVVPHSRRVSAIYHPTRASGIIVNYYSTATQSLFYHIRSRRRTKHVRFYFVCVIDTRLKRPVRFSDDAGSISKNRSRNTRKCSNSGIIKPLFDGLKNNTLLIVRTTQRAKYSRVLCV